MAFPDYTPTDWVTIASLNAAGFTVTAASFLGEPIYQPDLEAEWWNMTPATQTLVQNLRLKWADYFIAEAQKDKSFEQRQADAERARKALAELMLTAGGGTGAVHPSAVDPPVDSVQDAIDKLEKVDPTDPDEHFQPRDPTDPADELAGGGGGGAIVLLALLAAVMLSR